MQLFLNFTRNNWNNGHFKDSPENKQFSYYSKTKNRTICLVAAGDTPENELKSNRSIPKAINMFYFKSFILKYQITVTQFHQKLSIQKITRPVFTILYSDSKIRIPPNCRHSMRSRPA